MNEFIISGDILEILNNAKWKTSDGYPFFAITHNVDNLQWGNSSNSYTSIIEAFISPYFNGTEITTVYCYIRYRNTNGDEKRIAVNLARTVSSYVSSDNIQVF